MLRRATRRRPRPDLARDISLCAPLAEDCFWAGLSCTFGALALADVPFFEAYQPRQLDESELQALVKESIAEVEAENGEAPTMKQMGAVMKVANAKAAGQADGKRLSAEVKAQLS